MHRVHHKSKTPTPWTAYAFAPPEAVLEAGILPVAAFLLPMHEITIFLFVTHMIVRNVIGHAGVELFPGWWLQAPLLKWVTTTTHHDLHHSHGGYNFGLYFTWWDKCMNTEHPEYADRFMAASNSCCPIKSLVKENTQ
jgi:sterol desaturase/sphingolipid hydroxylase (fatty acid hydroxylase superfamily)